MKTTMFSRVRIYLAHRRALGYKLRMEGQMLANFARYADRSRHRGPLTRKLALQWAGLPKNVDSLYRARRLEVVRVFAKHQSVLEPATEIPPRHIYGAAHRRKQPHIYSPAQIRRLLRRASKLNGQLRPLTYRTLIGLLAGTGLRLTETLALQMADVDLEQGVVTIRESKYHHSRLVPLHPTCVRRLRHYASRRQKRFPLATHFFVSERGSRYSYSTVRSVFRELIQDLALVSNGQRSHVRLHDLRHTFACRVLLRWQRSRKGATNRVSVLSRYLGHQRVSDTFWYLSALPELFLQAAKSFPPPAL